MSILLLAEKSSYDEQQFRFFKVLFDALPALALVVDREGRVQSINSAAKSLFGVSAKEAYQKKAGQVFSCLYSRDAPGGCGHGPACQECDVRKTAMRSIGGQSVQRVKARLEVSTDGQYMLMHLLVSSAPLNYNGQKLAVVIIEDISLITELKGLLPICTTCKSIRDDDGYWSRLEEYIEKNSEALFTHDVCPDCMKRLYPGIDKSRRPDPA